MKIAVISLLPEMFDALKLGVLGRAIDNGLVELSFYNPRDFTTDRHGNVDDKPYGGGPGMLMQYQPLKAAIEAAKLDLPGAKVIYLSAQGAVFKQETALAASKSDSFIFICGRYEGIDQRVIDSFVDEEWCVGDYITSGGELPAMLAIDCIVRLLPGALGDDSSSDVESFSHGLLEHPQYTRPESVDGMEVPKVLISGNHAAIQAWREQKSLQKTWQMRPDLVKRATLTNEQQQLLEQLQDQEQK